MHDLRPTAARNDLGAVLEGWVFSELWKLLPSTAGLHFWRSTSKAEVDFVVSLGDLTIGVEVKAGRLGRPALPRSARSFVDAYQPQSFLVVCTDISHYEILGTTRVEWLHPRHLATRVTALLGN